MNDSDELQCPVCGEMLESPDRAAMSSTLKAHFMSAHGLTRAPPSGTRYQERSGTATSEPFADSGLGMPIMPDPSSVQTTNNPQTVGADARRGTGTHQQESSVAGKLAQSVDWLKGMTDLKASTPTSTMAPPTSSLMVGRTKLRTGLGDGMDAASIRSDLGMQAERDRVLLTGAHAGSVLPAKAMPPTVASEARDGEFGVQCPVCGDVLLSRKMGTLNRLLSEHMQSDHPRMLEPPLRS